MNTIVVLVVVMALSTEIMRFLPFVLLKFTDQTPAIVVKLGELLPSASMAMLIVYCLRSVNVTNPSSVVPAVTGVLTAAFVQGRFKSVVWAVISATVVYMAVLHLF